MTNNLNQAILDHESQDVAIIAHDVGKQFNQFVPRSYVAKILGNNKRAFSVSSARDRASESLDSKVALMEDVGRELLTQFADKGLSVADRMKVAQELRQWTKLSLDVAGIHDEESGQLWVIDSSWDTRSQSDVN